MILDERAEEAILILQHFKNPIVVHGKATNAQGLSVVKHLLKILSSLGINRFINIADK